MQTVSRLIKQFIPEHYHLHITLDRTERTFSGIVTINGTSLHGADNIKVHAKELAIESVVLDGKAARFAIGGNDELTITHPRLYEGRHVVVIAFSGNITDAMHGIYPCYYEHEGIKKELLSTQFQSHHAREVFPCIDEPEAKATFDVTLTTEKNIAVLGNMPIKQQSVESDRLVTTFDTTPRMSTYLLAWVTGELHRKTAVTKRGVQVNVWATSAQNSKSLDFGLNLATRTLDFFDEYFDTPYPLPKSDHVALPDFSAAAMENWGLIVYREVALLSDPATASISNKHYIAEVITHELSHQWFGNLVTMRWWDTLWLNESFATLMAYVAIDALHPEWNIWLDFATTRNIMALRRDSMENVQSVELDIHHPDEISTLFDSAIVYAKGARLLRMLQQYVGHEAFQAGLKDYFNTYAYNNTEGYDLWQILGKASSKDIAQFMKSWISQSGYPIVHAEQNDTQLTLSQQQFFVGPHKPSQKLWPIPLNASDSTLPALLTAQKVIIQHQAIAPLRLNAGDSAHFITHYDTNLLQELVEEVRRGSLTSIDRVQLLHEQTLLASGGIVSSAELIPLLDAFKHEATEPVWDIISLAIDELKKFVETDKVAEKDLHTLAQKLARIQYERLGWTPKESEPETDTKLRAIVLNTMLYGENVDTIKIALNLYNTKPFEQLDPELRSLIIGAAVRYSDDPEVTDTLLEAYRTTTSAELRQNIASGLASTRNKAVIKRLLALITDSNIIRHQDAMYWFIRLMRSRYGRELTWQWLQNNWGWIKKTFGGDKSYDNFPRYAAGMLVTRKQLEEYKSFFTPMKSESSLTRVISIGINEVEGRIELIERDSNAVRDALANV